MEELQNEPDLSWMSFNPEAHGIKPRYSVLPGFSNSSSREEELQHKRQAEKDADVSGWSRSSDNSSLDKSGQSRFRYKGKEDKDVKEPDVIAEKQWSFRRRKDQSKKLSAVYDDGESTTSGPQFVQSPVESRPQKFQGDKESELPHVLSSGSLNRGFQEGRKRWIDSLDDEEDEVDKLSWIKNYPSLKFARKFALGGLTTVSAITIFLLYISFWSTAQAPRACEVDKIVLNYTAQRIRLRGGRHVSFREQGVTAHRARHTLLVQHDLMSSRLAGIPGINVSLLEEFRVRLVSYDRPGYGQSDAHPGRSYSSSAQDMSDVADALGLGEKFWVVGFGIGGPHVWAAIKYIPDRLAGVALFAPAGSFYARNITRDEVVQTWGVLSLRQKWMYSVARHFPAVLPSLMQKALISDRLSPNQHLGANLGSKDQDWMKQSNVAKFWNEDVTEALNQRCAFPMAEELILLVDDWGFNLARLPFSFREPKFFLQRIIWMFQAQEKPRLFSGPIHIWQGTDDQIVPSGINLYAKRMVELNAFSEGVESPVKLHILKGEGHWSWFWFCSECHRSVFDSLFGPVEVSQFPTSHQGFSDEEFGALLQAFGSAEEVADRTSVIRGTSQGTDQFPTHSMHSRKDSALGAREKPEEGDKGPTGMMVYVPETCQAPMDVTTYVFRVIEEGIKKFIR